MQTLMTARMLNDILKFTFTRLTLKYLPVIVLFIFIFIIITSRNITKNDVNK